MCARVRRGHCVKAGVLCRACVCVCFGVFSRAQLIPFRYVRPARIALGGRIQVSTKTEFEAWDSDVGLECESSTVAQQLRGRVGSCCVRQLQLFCVHIRSGYSFLPPQLQLVLSLLPPAKEGSRRSMLS